MTDWVKMAAWAAMFAFGLIVWAIVAVAVIR